MTVYLGYRECLEHAQFSDDLLSCLCVCVCVCVCDVPDTNSAAALNATTHLIENQSRHQEGIAVVVIFLTDGKSNNESRTIVAAKMLHAALPQVTRISLAIAKRPCDCTILQVTQLSQRKSTAG